MTTKFSHVEDVAAWRHNFGLLRRDSLQRLTLRDLEDDLSGWNLMWSQTGLTVFGISPVGELAHLVSHDTGDSDTVSTDAIMTSLCYGAFWTIVPNTRANIACYMTCGFRTVATTPGIPGHENIWKQFDVALMVNPTGGPGAALCATSEQFQAWQACVSDWAKRRNNPDTGLGRLPLSIMPTKQLFQSDVILPGLDDDGEEAS